MDVDFANLEWHKAGTVTVLNGETTVRGTNTGWLAAGIKKGDVFLTEDFQVYQVVSVTNSGELQIDRAFQGDDYVGREYRIIPRASVVLQAEIMNRLTKIIPAWERQSLEIKETLAKLTAFFAGGIDSGEITNDSSSGGTSEGSGVVEVNGTEFE